MKVGQAASAANRFGLGAKPGELASIGDPHAWLLRQLRPASQPAAFSGLPDSSDILRREYAYKSARRAGKRDKAGADAPVDTATMPVRNATDAGSIANLADGDSGALKMQRRELARDGLGEIAVRYRWAATTDAAFVERLTRFWSNHFAVSIDKGQARRYAAPMEREAIRPHVLGNFSDLLLAVETHPAMLRYLDNVASIGEDSMFAARASRRMAMQGNDAPKRKLGLNENLAREILELHTLGVDGGYQQADVTEFARAITGWGTPLPRDFVRGDDLVGANARTGFVFRAAAHEPGARTVLGKCYADAGQAQGEAILRDLARHPATAKHLSLKLARHFVSDDPPPALVARMARAFLDSQGALAHLYTALIESPEAWSTAARKFKTPDDFVVSAMRAGAIDFDRDPRVLMQLLDHLGQPVFTPRSPAGFPDTAADWMAGDGLWKRIQAAEALADRVAVAQQNPTAAAQASLGAESVAGDFAAALRRAGSPRDGLALLFASPLFQWRA